MREAVNTFFNNDLYSVLSALEQTYNCSSFCKTPLFSLNSPISAATIPNQECFTRTFHEKLIKPEFKIITFITMGLLILSFFCAIPLSRCQPSEKKKTYD
jgi:hypothetical protein